MPDLKDSPKAIIDLYKIVVDKKEASSSNSLNNSSNNSSNSSSNSNSTNNSDSDTTKTTISYTFYMKFSEDLTLSSG